MYIRYQGISFIWLTLSLFGLASFASVSSGPPRISGGAENNSLLQRTAISPNYFGESYNYTPINLEALALPVVPGFDGPKFDDNNTLNRIFFIPPDNMGAAGPVSVISVINSIIEI